MLGAYIVMLDNVSSITSVNESKHKVCLQVKSILPISNEFIIKCAWRPL